MNKSAKRVIASFLQRVSKKYDPDDVKDYIIETHEYEREPVDPKAVEGWVDIAFGDATRLDPHARKGDPKKHIQGHCNVLEHGSLPTSVEDVEKIFTQVMGRSTKIRGSGQEVKPEGYKDDEKDEKKKKDSPYTPSTHVRKELIEWLDKYKGKMGSIESHKAFEEIHPGNDGNGRTGRLILLLGGFNLKKLTEMLKDGSYDALWKSKKKVSWDEYRIVAGATEISNEERLNQVKNFDLDKAVSGLKKNTKVKPSDFDISGEISPVVNVHGFPTIFLKGKKGRGWINAYILIPEELSEKMPVSKSKIENVSYDKGNVLGVDTNYLKHKNMTAQELFDDAKKQVIEAIKDLHIKTSKKYRRRHRSEIEAEGW